MVCDNVVTHGRQISCLGRFKIIIGMKIPFGGQAQGYDRLQALDILYIAGRTGTEVDQSIYSKGSLI